MCGEGEEFVKLTADHYLQASLERVTDLHILRREKRYAALVYSSGLAVECLLRAYRFKTDMDIESRHNLKDLMMESSIFEFLGEGEQRKFGEMLGEVWMRWRNAYRFASEDRLRAEFKRIGLTSKKKSDILKLHACKLSDAAIELVTIGARRWNSKKK